MANGGKTNIIKDEKSIDYEFLSPSTMSSFHSEPVERFMTYCVNYFVRGGVGEERLPSQPRDDKERKSYEGMDGYYGWGGWGGSQMQWHPEEKIAFAFVPSFLSWIDVGNQKGRKMQREVLRCVKTRRKSTVIDENDKNDKNDENRPGAKPADNRLFKGILLRVLSLGDASTDILKRAFRFDGKSVPPSEMRFPFRYLSA